MQEPFVVPVAFLTLGVQVMRVTGNVLRGLRARLELLVLERYSRFHFEDEETPSRFFFCCMACTLKLKCQNVQLLRLRFFSICVFRAFRLIGRDAGRVEPNEDQTKDYNVREAEGRLGYHQSKPCFLGFRYHHWFCGNLHHPLDLFFKHGLYEYGHGSGFSHLAGITTKTKRENKFQRHDPCRRGNPSGRKEGPSRIHGRVGGAIQKPCHSCSD